VIFLGAAPGLAGPSIAQSFCADIGGEVASGDGTEGMALYDAFRKVDPPGGKKEGPADIGGDMAEDAAGGLAACG